MVGANRAREKGLLLLSVQLNTLLFIVGAACLCLPRKLSSMDLFVFYEFVFRTVAYI